MHPAEIQAAIKVAGFSQAQIAAACGVAPNSVSAVIHSRSRSANVEQRISEILGIPVSELWPHWFGRQVLPGVTGLTAEERTLIEAWRALPPARREELKVTVDQALSSAGPVY